MEHTIFTKIIIILLLITTQSLANENWIPIESLKENQTPQKTTKADSNFSQIQPIKKMIKNAAVIKQLMDSTPKKEIKPKNDKKWFPLKEETK